MASLRTLIWNPRAQLVIFAFLIRVTWVLVVPSRPVGDFALYREAATYLVEHGHLDPEFIYMPGYVFALAAIEAAGGGLLAQKLLGVLFGTLLVAAGAGITDRLFGRRAGITAALLLAAWPAGIAVSSVTGTDVPAGALIATAIFFLVADLPANLDGGGGAAARNPNEKSLRAGSWTGALAAGAVMGLAGWVRAVAIPLIALSVFVWRARGLRWRHAAARAALGVVVATLVLAPWALRNARVYGELFLSDSHGGHTALVGSNPNSDGTYSRSLNRIFTLGTGFRLFDTPSRHRASDAAAYALAKRWARVEPFYAAGLLGAKADRLLAHERNLLYWPIFRAGVLDSGLPDTRGPGDDILAWFARHREPVEAATDGFWWAVCALGVTGLALAFARLPRSAAWLALAVAAFPGALTVLYTVFFAEVRYHLAIAPLVFPHAGFAATWLYLRGRDGFRGDGRALGASAMLVVLTLAGFCATLALGARLRERHRWAICVCHLPDPKEIQLCAWRRLARQHGNGGGGDAGDSPLRGVWDGVGLRLAAIGSDPDEGANEILAAVGTEVERSLSAGRYRVRARLSLTAAPRPVDGRGAIERASSPSHPMLTPGGDVAALDREPPAVGADETLPSVAMRVGEIVVARALFTAGKPAASPAVGAPPDQSAAARGDAGAMARDALIDGVIDHSGGPLELVVEVESPASRSTVDGKTLWISDLSVERFPASEIIAPQ